VTGIRYLMALILGGSMLFAAGAPAFAQDTVAQFYRGKTLSVVIGSAPGGGYDTFGRLLARYMSRHMPGNPTVVPRNMPGASSYLAANYISAVAPRDGTAIAAVTAGALLQPLFGRNAQAGFDPGKLNYVGSASKDYYVCIVRADSPAKSFKDVFTHEVTVAAAAEGGSARDFPVMLNNVLGTKFKVVTGYVGNKEGTLAIERGEVQGVCGNSWRGLLAMHPDWFGEGGFARVLVQEDTVGYPDLNKRGIPRTVDFATTAEQRQIIELVYQESTLGRPYIMPPDVPADRVAAVQKAFLDTFGDPELLAEAHKISLDVSPISGEAVAAVIASMYRAPPRIIQKARDALLSKP
jgi:tripartite-type tricarboxylate transporter receptor subunit TctC